MLQYRQLNCIEDMQGTKGKVGDEGGREDEGWGWTREEGEIGQEEEGGYERWMEIGLKGGGWSRKIVQGREINQGGQVGEDVDGEREKFKNECESTAVRRQLRRIQRD